MSSWISMLVGTGTGAGDPNAPGGAANQDPRDMLVRFADRLKHATLAEDRRASLLSIKGLARDYKPLVIECALDSLATALRRDSHDSAMAKIIVETLAILFTIHPKKPEEKDMVTRSSEDFTDDSANVACILDLLEDYDFHLRFDALQLLATLLKLHPDSVIAGVLSNPMGVSKLMDLLNETREAVRTETILFLVALTRSNTEIQKIVAFQNAFDLLFHLLQSDPTVDPVTGHDCLQLIHNLMRLNPSNQNLFRESGCVPKLGENASPSTASRPATLQGALSSPTPFAWTKDQQTTCLHLLSVVRALIVPNASSSRAAQDALAAASILGCLLELSLAAGVPYAVKTAALHALGDCRPGDKGAVMLIVGIAVLGIDEGGGEVREEEELQSYVTGHADGQLALAMTIVNPPPDEVGGPSSLMPASDHPLANSVVLQPLIDWQIRDDLRTWFAAMITASLVVGNDRAKEVMAGMYAQQMHRSKQAFDTKRRESRRRASLVGAGLDPAVAGLANGRIGDGPDDSDEEEEEDEEDTVTLVQSIGHTLVFSSRGNAVVRTQVALLSVLCCWTWDCPKAVADVVSDSTILQFLIEQASSTTGEALYYPTAAPLANGGMTHDQLFQVLSTRIGSDQLQVKLTRLREDVRFVDWKKAGAYLDDVIVSHINDTFGELLRGVRQSPEAKTRSAQDLEQRSGKVVHLEAKVVELEKLLEERTRVYEAKVQELESENHRLISQLEAARSSLATMESDQNDLLVCLAEQDNDMRRLRDRLRQLGDSSLDVAGAGGSGAAAMDSSSQRSSARPSPRVTTLANPTQPSGGDLPPQDGVSAVPPTFGSASAIRQASSGSDIPANQPHAPRQRPATKHHLFAAHDFHPSATATGAALPQTATQVQRQYPPNSPLGFVAQSIQPSLSTLALMQSAGGGSGVKSPVSVATPPPAASASPGRQPPQATSGVSALSLSSTYAVDDGVLDL
ncbi:hypothetical protein BCR44DRAFT_1423535 [Catenaria anguillulae PL171]|uniref:P115 like vesicle tethering protein n=1 Tax=Catenaria anguillulae PL171 TaxID=765915 RepID=A0A1Y2I1P7_9FUNG|nr:hypothetical protein BCR44DRAFT_1423535 [Catenaria anguillulae PL171]